eukprot:5244369-Heterocapsa_arctica.AAC.1
MPPKVMEDLPLNTHGLPAGAHAITSNPYAVDMVGPMEMRPELTAVDQLENLINRALLRNHQHPITRTWYDHGNGI